MAIQSVEELISDIRVTAVRKDALRAFVSFKIADHFYISNIRIVEGARGLFVAMPARKEPNGDYMDIFFPANREAREVMEKKILDKYREVFGDSPK